LVNTQNYSKTTGKQLEILKTVCIDAENEITITPLLKDIQHFREAKRHIQILSFDELDTIKKH
jgi:hypothetical protein